MCFIENMYSVHTHRAYLYEFDLGAYIGYNYTSSISVTSYIKRHRSRPTLPGELFYLSYNFALETEIGYLDNNRPIHNNTISM